MSSKLDLIVSGSTRMYSDFSAFSHMTWEICEGHRWSRTYSSSCFRLGAKCPSFSSCLKIWLELRLLKKLMLSGFDNLRPNLQGMDSSITPLVLPPPVGFCPHWCRPFKFALCQWYLLLHQVSLRQTASSRPLFAQSCNLLVSDVHSLPARIFYSSASASSIKKAGYL